MFMPTPRNFFKSYNGSDKTKPEKNCSNKCQKIILKNRPFWSTSKNLNQSLKHALIDISSEIFF